MATHYPAKTTRRVVRAVAELQAALIAEYGPDYSFRIHGRGHLLASSEMGLGTMVPHSDEPESK